MPNDTENILDTLAKTTAQPMDKAQALPFPSYIDKSVFELEKKKIFHRDWIFICSEKELPNTGDYLAFFLAEEPVMLIRGDDNTLRAFGNICRHRGTLLNEEGFGNTPRMVCPYHAWTYNLQGECIATPYAENEEVDNKCHSLSNFSIEIWNELVFINLADNAPPISQKLSGIQKYLELFGVTKFTETIGEQECETWKANWKLAVENAMESYHLFKVHSQTLEKITPTKEAFYLETSGDWTITGGHMREEKKSFFSWLSNSERDIYSNYILISLPPSFVGILTYESFDWISILPKNQYECVVRGCSRREPGYTLSADEKYFVQAFLAEDKKICERIQSGMTATHSVGGKLLNIERVVVDFHNYLSMRLFNAPSPKVFKSVKVKDFFD